MHTIPLVLLIGMIFFSILQIRKSRREKKAYKQLESRARKLNSREFKLLCQKDELEREIRVLRESNRAGNKAAQAERRRLQARARDAELHAEELQCFHLQHEQDLQHELANAYALVEILMDRVPKGAVVTIDQFEAQRLFRPIIEAFPTPRTQADPTLDRNLFKKAFPHIF